MIKFRIVKSNLVNVIVNGKESNWYVEKNSNGWYNILWGTANYLMSFRKQSWFSSQSKEDIKEKLEKSVNKPVLKVWSDDSRLYYVYQVN